VFICFLIHVALLHLLSPSGIICLQIFAISLPFVVVFIAPLEHSPAFRPFLSPSHHTPAPQTQGYFLLTFCTIYIYSLTYWHTIFRAYSPSQRLSSDVKFHWSNFANFRENVDQSVKFDSQYFPPRGVLGWNGFAITSDAQFGDTDVDIVHSTHSLIYLPCVLLRRRLSGDRRRRGLVHEAVHLTLNQTSGRTKNELAKHFSCTSMRSTEHHLIGFR